MEKDEAFNAVLKFIKGNKYHYDRTYTKVKNGCSEIENLTDILSEMISTKLIQQDKNGAYELGAFGWEVGDWLKYLDTEKQKEAIKREKENKADNKLDLEIYNLKESIAKLKKDNKYFWIPYALSVSALIFSGLTLIVSNSKQNRILHRQDLIDSTLLKQANKPDLLRFQQDETTKAKNP